MSQDRNGNNSQPSSYLPTKKQWGIVTATGIAASPGGPIVMATATAATVAGCYLSNAMGWSGD